MDNKITVSNIVNYLSNSTVQTIPYKDSLSLEIIGPRDIFSADKNNITFLSNKLIDNAAELLSSNKASIVILSKEIFQLIKGNSFEFTVIVSDDPKTEIINCLSHFYKDNSRKHKIHSSAIIEKGAIIGGNVQIGSNVFVSSNSIIGDNAIIEENVVIKNTTINKNCLIKANSVIGNSGFGFQQDKEGNQVEFPHFGRVLIGENVQVGSNTCIDRGALSDTVIENGVKIDNLVHIAHNVSIGENSLIIANVLIGGSTKIGKKCWIAPSATLKNGISIADETLIGMGAVVTKNVLLDKIVAGSPAISLDDFKKWMLFKKDVISENSHLK